MFSDHVLAAKVRQGSLSLYLSLKILIEQIVNSTTTLPCQSTPIQPIKSH